MGCLKRKAANGKAARTERTIRAVLIDVDDTLLDFGESSKDAFRYALRETGYALPPETFGTFERINAGLWERVEKGTLTKARLHEIRWDAIFEELGLSGFDGVLFERSFYGRLSRTAFPVAGAKELLAHLSAGYRVYAASNASHDQQETRLSRAGLDVYFTDFFVSGDLGENKPAAAFFDKCFERMDGVRPEETALIGDSIAADISGGNAYGLLTVWYNHNRKPDPTDPALVPDYKVDSLAEIHAIL